MNKTLIIGAGRSALGAARLLLSQGKAVLVSDITEKFPDMVSAIRAAGATLVIGPQTPALLTDVERLVVSPGLSPDIPILQAARERKIPILSEIDLALSAFSGRVAAVTGTNGKSTTTTVLAHLLQSQGVQATASGNIGIAPSLLIADGQAPEVFVLELSSYQLDFSQPIANTCSLFMSFSPDHLERHGTLENYFRAKWKLIQATRPEGLVIMPRLILDHALRFAMPPPRAAVVQLVFDDEAPLLDYVPSRLVRIDSRRGLVSGQGFARPEKLPEGLSYHNQLNVAAAALAAKSLKADVSWPLMMKAMAHYEWLPYRFQLIGTRKGEPVFNDSKSTNVESTLVALKSLRKSGLVMLGGHPKGESFTPIAKLRDRVHTLVAFGAAGQQIAKDLKDLDPKVFPTLKDALGALPQLLDGKELPLLFSPACSSFDEFKNFEERGAFFNQVLQALLDKTDPAKEQ